MDISKDFNLTVGLRIREIREAMQMTRERFSELCGISDSFLAAVESGKKSITSKTIYKICYIAENKIVCGNIGIITYFIDRFRGNAFFAAFHSG